MKLNKTDRKDVNDFLRDLDLEYKSTGEIFDEACIGLSDGFTYSIGFDYDRGRHYLDA